MKLAAAQLNYTVGDLSGNYEKICQATTEAISQQADLIVFSELAICGYPPHDLLKQEGFIEACIGYVNQLAEKFPEIGIIIGSPNVNPLPDGKPYQNNAYFLFDGKVQYSQSKWLLPDYDVFDEYRFFESGESASVIEFKGKRIALTICEDIWLSESRRLYKHYPLDTLRTQKPDFCINIAASPYHNFQQQKRKHTLESNFSQYGFPMIYVNQVGANTDLIFDGRSGFYNGAFHDFFKPFESGVKVFSLADKLSTNTYSEVAQLHMALVSGIRDFFQKSGFKKAILGLSGGIDSAVTLALAGEALGPENVFAVLLPSQYSSDHSVSDSEEMAKRMNCPYTTIPIKDAFESLSLALAPTFQGLSEDVTEENLQSRIRGTLLMAISNKMGHILLNTTNKSEAATGYGTLYGDMCGALGVLGDVYKTKVYELANYHNTLFNWIPENIITKAPSAELRPDQFDSDSLPDYDILDEVLRLYLEERHSISHIIKQGFDALIVERIVGLINRTEYKRFQAAPVLRVTKKAFGYGRKMPLVSRVPKL